MIPVKDLVISITRKSQIIINKTFVKGKQQRSEFNFVFNRMFLLQVFKNRVQPFYLFRAVSENNVLEIFLLIRLKIGNKQRKIFIE